MKFLTQLGRKTSNQALQRAPAERRYPILWELRGALRTDNPWVAHSRRYANPETYLIPRERWPSLRPEVCQHLQLPTEGETRLDARAAELEALLGHVDRMLGRNGRVRMEQGELIVSPLEAEERPASVVALEQHLTTGSRRST